MLVPLTYHSSLYEFGCIAGAAGNVLNQSLSLGRRQDFGPERGHLTVT